MNGNGRYESDEAILGVLDSFEADEADEADYGEAPRFSRRPVRSATGSGLYQPRPSSNYVTQAQLQTALARVGAQIKTNSDAITTINGRVNNLGAEQSRQGAALRKEIADRKKETDALKRDLRQTRDVAILADVLFQPKSITTTQAVDGIPQGTKLLTDSGDSFSALLPILLLSGIGSGSGSGGLLSGDGGDNSLLLLLLLTRR